MDALVELLLPLIFHRRVGVAAAIALLVAVLLAVTFAPFTGLHGILVLLLGLGAGMLWEIDASRNKSNSD
jgi:uncharacterized membrane protein YdfJ with MMPL/SSD domain